MAHPLRGATPHFKSTANREEQLKVHRLVDPCFALQHDPHYFDDATVIDLGPGSLLYHPAGVWHSVEATDDSLSVNISLVGMTWADVAADAVRSLLYVRVCGRCCCQRRRDEPHSSCTDWVILLRTGHDSALLLLLLVTWLCAYWCPRSRA